MTLTELNNLFLDLGCPKEVVKDALEDMTDGCVYVVSGESGRYSDRAEWVVHAFRAEADAIYFCQMLNDWAIREGVSRENWNRDYDLDDPTNPLDPGMRICYDGVKYSVDAVSFTKS